MFPARDSNSNNQNLQDKTGLRGSGLFSAAMLGRVHCQLTTTTLHYCSPHSAPPWPRSAAARTRRRPESLCVSLRGNGPWLFLFFLCISIFFLGSCRERPHLRSAAL